MRFQRPDLLLVVAAAPLVLILLSGSPAMAIIFAQGHDPALSDSSSHAGVGNISGFCTAAAIAPQVLLTAAHCTPASVDRLYFSFDVDGDGIREGYRFLRSFVDHPGWSNDGRRRRHVSEYQHDIAIVFLEDPLPPTVPIYRLWNGPQVPVGAAVYIVGYGTQGVAGAPRSNSSDGVFDRRVATNVIGASIYGGNIFQVDFTNKPYEQYLVPCSGKDCSLAPRAVGSHYREGITAPGDSGGPTFLSPAMDFDYNFPNGLPPPRILTKPITSESFLVGITSHGNMGNYGYGTVSGMVFVGTHRDWIEGVIGSVDAASSGTDLYSARTSVDFGVSEVTADPPMDEHQPEVFEDQTDGPVRGPCGLDVDRTGAGKPNTDGVYLYRHVLGLEYVVPEKFRILLPALPDNSIISSRIDRMGELIDVDGDGEVRASTDGVYIYRYLLGLQTIVPSPYRQIDPSIPSDSDIIGALNAICDTAGLVDQ